MLFNHVRKKSEKQKILRKKIFTLTAPTGLGKTLTSVNSALNVGRRIQQERGFTPRIIYVAPFISILDQNMEVLQNVFHMQGQQQQTNLLLMHHHLAPITYAKKDVIEEQRRKTIAHPSLNF
jgi:CRISPR-associated endonuclease/helicase Cas3